MINKILKQQLLKLLNQDQAIRQPNSKWDSNIDSKNTEELKHIINQYGWPKISEVGEEAAEATWLVIQHSADISFQKQCLNLLKNAVKAEEAKKRWVAFLTDKILIKENKPQMYGTQFRIDLKKSKFVPYSINNPSDLDKRRKEYELESFNDYRKKFNNEDAKKEFYRQRFNTT